MGDAVDRLDSMLDSMLDQLESPEKPIEQGSSDEPTISLHEPFVVTGRVNLQLSELIESDLLNALHKHSKSGAAVAMVADEDDRILESLCEAVIMLFPVEPDRRHEPELPFSWAPALRRSIAESHLEAGLQRYLLIDQFHLILTASEKDQRAFGRVLRQLAALETVTVIARRQRYRHAGNGGVAWICRN